MPKKTDNHEYKIPQRGEQDWDKPLNENFERFELDIEIRDKLSTRSNYEPKPGAKFFAVNTGDVFVGDGSDWLRVPSTGTLPSFGAEANVGVEVEFKGTSSESTAMTIYNGGQGAGIYSTASNAAAILADGRDTTSALHAAGKLFVGPDFAASNVTLNGGSGNIETIGDISLKGRGGVDLLNITDGTLEYRTPTNAAAKEPMMTMYGGGETNPERPVVVHSRDYDDWGLFYDDSADTFVFRAQGQASARLNLGTAGSTTFEVDGDIEATGDKNFVQSVDTDDGEKEVVYTATEAGTPHTEVSGVAELNDGRAEVDLVDHFGWVTSEDEPIVVQITPYGGQSGTKVVERTTERIVVEDLDGEGDYEFAYTVKGTRAGHGDKQVVREPTSTADVQTTGETPADD